MVVAESPVIIQSDEMDDETVPTKQGPVFTIEILKLIVDAQQQHGLRHSDYQRYRFLYIPLMLAERAWSYAMQLRQESNTEPRKKFHLVSKMKKAVHHAEQLEALCQSELCDARSKLEAQAYAAWIRGSFYFEVKAWKEAMDNLHQAQVVYEKLCSAVNESDQSIYKEKCNDLVPSLRYCAYSVGDDTAISDLKSLQGSAQGNVLDTLDRLMAEARLKDGGSKAEVTWRGKTIQVKPASVSSFLVAEDEISSQIDIEASQANIDKLERHIINCKDAIASVRDEMTAAKSKGDVSANPLQVLLTYLTHIRLTRSNQRTSLMIAKASLGEDGKKGKPQDLIRLYELILQNLNEMQQLNGLENDDEYQKDIESYITAYKAFRCFYIGEALAVTKKLREALALYEKAAAYSKSASESKKVKQETQLMKQLVFIQNQIEGAKSTCLAQAILQASSDDKEKASSSNLPNYLDKKHLPKVALVDRLDEYLEDPKLASKQANIIKLPPDMKPIPCKPLYFDVAMNYLTLPVIEEKLEKKQTSSGANLTGFVKGLWGWGGKK